MRFRLGHLGIIPIAAMAFTLTGCAAELKWPACEKDEDCKKNDKGEPVDFYCVNKQCQECKDDSHCDTGQGEYCNNGRCDKKAGWCQTDGDCSGGLVCKESTCEEVSCTSDEDCQEGQICQDGVCATSGCISDQQCAAGEKCENGECVPTGEEISSACRPMSTSGDAIALGTVNFDFNEDALRVDARGVLDQNAECLREAPGVTIVVEGHCDERGTQEYNLGLGDRRADAVKRYLRNLGIDMSRMLVVSKGKNEPLCRRSTESCWDRIRLVEFIQKRGTY